MGHVRHLFVDLYTGSLSSGTIQSGIGSDDLVNELSDSLLILSVGLEGVYKVRYNPSDRDLVVLYLLEVGAVVTRREPGRLSVRN